MDRGARVKFRPGSKACAKWRVSETTPGLVLARYHSMRDGQPERIDVLFAPNLTVWGERISEFEEAPSDPSGVNGRN